MNIRRFILSGVAAASIICIPSCNKDKTKELPYLTGLPQFSLPVFGTSGEVFEFKSGGVTADDDSEVRYYWYASPIQPKKDTCDVYKLVLTDSLCTVKLTCVAFAKGYNTTSYSEEITIVNPDRDNGSIQGITMDPEKDFIFTDPRDGFEYRCTTIGSKAWFKDNLAYRKHGRPQEGCLATADIFGMLYTWEEAMDNACPEGWHVSSLQDWADAADAAKGTTGTDKKDMLNGVAGKMMGDATFNFNPMWEYSANVRITNESGLGILPVGFANVGALKDEFYSMYQYATFWTSDMKDDETAYYRYIYFDQNDVLLGSADKKSFGASVRCVRND